MRSLIGALAYSVAMTVLSVAASAGSAIGSSGSAPPRPDRPGLVDYLMAPCSEATLTAATRSTSTGPLSKARF